MTPAPTRGTGSRLLTDPAGDLRVHLHRHGPAPALDLSTLVAALDAAGLRGRGGGGFPTATKLRAVADATSAVRRRRLGRHDPVVVANGCEGEPDSAKDTVLLHHAPHLVLDGLAVAAHALGAGDVVLCVRAGSRHARLRAALAERRDPVAVRVEAVPDRYIASEESALVGFLSGGAALPRTVPPRPAESGVAGAPTLLDNVETLAHLALIARHGPGWFRAVGSPDLPGTLLVTIGGAVRRPGVVEVAAGTTVRAAIDHAGGPTTRIQAVLSGGYGGAWLPARAIDTPLTHDALRAAGSALGVPTLIAQPATACGLARTATLLEHLVDESAGQCGPCMFGLPAITNDLADILARGRSGPATLSRLERRLEVVPGRGACAHPDGAVRLVRSALRVFDADLRAHLGGQPCLSAGDESDRMVAR